MAVEETVLVELKAQALLNDIHLALLILLIAIINFMNLATAQAAKLEQFSLALGMVTVSYQTVKAARTNPVQSLRYE